MRGQICLKIQNWQNINLKMYERTWHFFAIVDSFFYLISLVLSLYSVQNGAQVFPLQRRKKFLLPLGSYWAASREESFHRRSSVGSETVTGRIWWFVVWLQSEASSGQPVSEGHTSSLGQVGTYAKYAATQKVTKAKAGNNDLLHRPIPKEKKEKKKNPFFSILSDYDDFVIVSEFYFLSLV